jgi:hypothetical protein
MDGPHSRMGLPHVSITDLGFGLVKYAGVRLCQKRVESQRYFPALRRA